MAEPLFTNPWAAVQPDAALIAFEWALLIALAAFAGHWLQRATRLPKIVGYALVGIAAGLVRPLGLAWPLDGAGLFLLELGIAIVVFDAGARLPLRWFRHNPLVLLQSAAEALLTYAAAFLLLRALGMDLKAVRALATIAVAASPSVLMRIATDMRASGPVTDRAFTLTTLNTLYALTLGVALLHTVDRGNGTLLGSMGAALAVLGVSAVLGLLLAAVLAVALRFLQPTSPDTAIVVLAGVAACTTVAGPLGGAGPIAALLGGLLLKQFHARPWVWPRQLGTAASTVLILMFVLISVVAAHGAWEWRAVGVALLLMAVRIATKMASIAFTAFHTGITMRQTLWVGAALAPMAAVALLLTTQFAASSHTMGVQVTAIALPLILLSELLGAVAVSVALRRAGEIPLPAQRGEQTPPRDEDEEPRP